MLFQFILGAPVVRISLVVIAFEHGHLVIEFATAQWILDEMQVGPNPIPDSVQSGRLNYFFHRNRATVGHKLYTNRLSIIKYTFAYDRAKSIGSDQSLAFIHGTICTGDSRTISQIIDRDDFSIRF